MKKEKCIEYKVTPGLFLHIKDLWAEVTISAGEDGIAKISMSEGEELLEDIKISQFSNSIIKGSVHMNIWLDGSAIIRSDSTKNDELLPKIEIIVPKGTDLGSCAVRKLTASGLGRILFAYVSSQSELTVTDVNGLYLTSSGENKCSIKNATGNAELIAKHRSSIDVYGDFKNIYADAIDQCSIKIIGNCLDFEAEANQQSHIKLFGVAKGKIIQKSSGQSDVDIVG